MSDEIDRFWARFENPPSFQGKRILEVGCGKGDLSVALGHAGAKHVVGADILETRVDNANARIHSEHPELNGVVEFTARPIAELDLPPFDIVVSKDSFEHIINVPAMLDTIRDHLVRNGVVYIGFSPLYHSPYGDHDRRKTAFRAWGLAGLLLAILPWGHLVLERQIIARHNMIKARPVKSMHDLNLNMMSIGKFRRYLTDAGFVTRYFAVNRGGNPLGWPFSILRHIPGLEKYCTYNVYCELMVASDGPAVG